MKQSNFQNHKSAQTALKAAFEKGYLLGKNDFNEGIFIDLKSVVEQFGNSLPSELDIS